MGREEILIQTGHRKAVYESCSREETLHSKFVLIFYTDKKVRKCFRLKEVKEMVVGDIES